MIYKRSFKGILSEISPTQMTVYTVKWQYVPVESSLIFVVSYEKYKMLLERARLT